MIEEKQGYYLVTEEGKKEFALHSTASRSNLSMIIVGIAIIFFTFSVQFGIVPVISVIFFGIALIIIGLVFLVIGRRSRPKLPLEAKGLLKELNRH
jgi:ABC-type multidrug transport system fused ATPase/permease subunit